MAMREVVNFELHVDMHCPCQGCIKKIKNAMDSIGNFEGVKSSVVDIDSGSVTVVGRVDPTALRDWLKKKTRKDVKIVFPTPPAEKPKQTMKVTTYEESYRKITTVTFSKDACGSTGRGSTPWCPTPSAPPLPEVSRSSVPSGGQSDDNYLRSIEEKIRELEKIRDHLKIKNLEKELQEVKRELEQCKKVINSSKKELLDGALNQLRALTKSEAFSFSD